MAENVGDTLYKDPWIKIDLVEAAKADGTTYPHRRITVRSGMGSIVIPVTRFRGSTQLAMVTQSRPAIGKPESWEFIRGGTDDLSDTEAMREVLEESGLVPRSISKVGTIHTDTGILSTEVAVWTCAIPSEDLSFVQGRVEEESGAKVHWVSPGEFASKVSQGIVTCSMSLAAYLLADRAGRFVSF